MVDRPQIKLGKKAAKHDPRRLKLAKYLTPSLGTPPAAKDWTGGRTSFGMMLNDQLGDCTIAGCGHAVQICSGALGTEITIPDSIILTYYENWDGYNPKDPSSDQGGVETDVLDNWRQRGFSGHELVAYCDPEPANLDHVKWSICLFGGLYIGLQLPNSAIQQNQNGQDWDVISDDGGLADGHCVFVVGYDSTGLTCITWGQLQKMTWSFWQKYCDEAHALLLKDFLNAASDTADGVDLASLQADLQLITG